MDSRAADQKALLGGMVAGTVGGKDRLHPEFAEPGDDCFDLKLRVPQHAPRLLRAGQTVRDAQDKRQTEETGHRSDLF